MAFYIDIFSIIPTQVRGEGGYLVIMKICLSGLYLLVLTGKLGEQGRNYFYSTLGLIAYIFSVIYF